MVHHRAWLKTERKLGPEVIHISHDNCLYLAQRQPTASHHCAPIASLCISQIIQFDHTVILSSTFIQVPSHFFPHLQRSRARRKREFHALCHYQRPGERAGNSNGGPQTKLDTPAGFNSAHLCWSIAGKISAPGRGKLKLCVGPKS